LSSLEFLPDIIRLAKRQFPMSWGTTIKEILIGFLHASDPRRWLGNLHKRRSNRAHAAFHRLSSIHVNHVQLRFRRGQGNSSSYNWRIAKRSNDARVKCSQAVRRVVEISLEARKCDGKRWPSMPSEDAQIRCMLAAGESMAPWPQNWAGLEPAFLLGLRF
jgi:hypothetical protein